MSIVKNNIGDEILKQYLQEKLGYSDEKIEDIMNEIYDIQNNIICQSCYKGKDNEIENKEGWIICDWCKLYYCCEECYEKHKVIKRKCIFYDDNLKGCEKYRYYCKECNFDYNPSSIVICRGKLCNYRIYG